MGKVADLKRRTGKAKVVNSSPPKNPTMAPREPSTKNTGDPRGKFGRFLRAYLARKDDKDGDDLGVELGKSARTIRLWAQGEAGPAFSDLDRVAEAMGYSNWATLAVAVERFCEKHPE